MPAGIALGALLAGFLLVAVNREAFGWWYPCTLPINVRLQGLYDTTNLGIPALFDAAAGLALAQLVCRDLARRVSDN